jgi:tetratricopeptide (TPR) repeat protein
LLERVRTLSADDPHIAQLRTAAETAIHEGHFDQAEELLNKASAWDVAAAQELQNLTTKRLLSAAEAKAANGMLKMIQLVYADAAEYYRQAATLVEQLPVGNEAHLASYLHAWGGASYDTRDYTGAAAPLQRALTLYRQLAEQNPLAYLPNVAMTLHNLGTLYSHTQRLSDSEQAYHEALTTYRQLAEQNPLAYLPDVAMTLHNLAILEFHQGHFQPVKMLIDEALTIRRSLWKQHSTVYGNDLAQSFAVEIMLLQCQEDQETLICQRLHEMTTVAKSETLKQWAQERMAEMCPSGE